MAGLNSAQIRQAQITREQKAPEMARQVKRRGNADADGGIHKVKRTQAKSRKQEAAAVTDVERAPIRRWTKSSALPALPCPPGFHIEYVRRDNQHRGDHENLIAHISEGWEFCRKTDFPTKSLPTQRLTDFGECIGNASSILMKIPEELKAQRDEYYNKRRNAATRGISRPDPTPGGVGHEHMPIVEDVNKFTVTTSNKARARRAPTRMAD